MHNEIIKNEHGGFPPREVKASPAFYQAAVAANISTGRQQVATAVGTQDEMDRLAGSTTTGKTGTTSPGAAANIQSSIAGSTGTSSSSNSAAAVTRTRTGRS